MIMANNISKTKPKRLPKGQRLHVRRLKQTARKEAILNNPRSMPAQPVPVHKKQDQAI
jgi:hypothetical protein